MVAGTAIRSIHSVRFPFFYVSGRHVSRGCELCPWRFRYNHRHLFIGASYLRPPILAKLVSTVQLANIVYKYIWRAYWTNNNSYFLTKGSRFFSVQPLPSRLMALGTSPVGEKITKKCLFAWFCMVLPLPLPSLKALPLKGDGNFWEDNQDLKIRVGKNIKL